MKNDLNYSLKTKKAKRFVKIMQKNTCVLRKEISISNVVCTADLKQRVNIKKFVKYPWGIFDEAIYGGKCGYVKSPDMQGRITIFPTGKMISIGAKSIKNAIEQIYQAQFHLVISKIVSETKLEPKIQNIVAMTNFKKKIDVHKLARTLPHCVYEPEVFPGLIYSFLGSTRALIFSSGKIVIPGAKSLEELNSAYFELEKIIHISD